MKSHISLTSTLSLPCSTFRVHTKSPSLAFLNRKSFVHFDLLRLPPNPNFKAVGGLRFDGPVMDIGELSESEDSDLVVETCITRTLPPALTLEHGLESIKEAVEKLKLNAPSSTSGVFRFQVAVPPSAKALNWFCCQPQSSGVFPQFFLSKETKNPTFKSLYLNETCGVFGIGAAICFTCSSSSTLRAQSFIKRYLSNDSIFVTTYGFMDINFDSELSSMKHESGSFYFFIPQIELNELEAVSILAATLAWSESYFCTFEQAIQSYESSLDQASCHFWSTFERRHSKLIRSTLRKLNVAEDKTVQMVYTNALSSGKMNFGADPMELVSSFS